MRRMTPRVRRFASLALLVSCALLGLSRSPTFAAAKYQALLDPLLGTYDSGPWKIAVPDFGVRFREIRAIQIFWEGRIEHGFGRGNGTCRDREETFPWPAKLVAVIDANHGYWQATIGETHFAAETPFEGFFDANFDFLLDGAGEMAIFLDPENIICGFMTEEPTGYLQDVHLLVLGDAYGDLNCDGAVDTFDLEPMIQALTDARKYQLQYPGCDARNADLNGDGTLDFFDIEAFIVCVVNHDCQ